MRGNIISPQEHCIHCYVVAQVYPWLKLYFLLFQNHYHTCTCTQKQKKMKCKARIKLNHNIYIKMLKLIEIMNYYHCTLSSRM